MTDTVRSDRRRSVGRSALRLGATGVLVAFVLASVWLRDPVPDVDGPLLVDARPLKADARTIAGLDPFTLEEAWNLTSKDRHFRGLSGMAMLPDRRLLIVTDRGQRIAMAAPGRPGRNRIRPIRIKPRPPFGQVDAESVTFDPDTRESWVGAETLNRIGHYNAGGRYMDSHRPAAMRDWRENTGAEAMLRLDDGRLMVIGEDSGTGGERLYPVLVFPGADLMRDPLQARLDMPGSYRPVGLAGLPDGRVLVLGRSFAFPLNFQTVIAVADPVQIRQDRVWRAKPIARISGGPLADNYEGIAACAAPDGRLVVWLVSDNNDAVWIQSTKLLKLSIDPEDIANGSTRDPRSKGRGDRVVSHKA